MSESVRIGFVAFCVALVVAGCSDSESCPFELAGSQWLLIEVGGVEIVVPEGQRAPMLEFSRGVCEVMGFAGCNNYFGGYDFDGDAIRFGPMATTKMACGAWPDEVERLFLAALENTRAWQIESGILRFTSESGATVARFVPAG